MSNNFNLKKFSYLVYGLGTTGQSVIKYFKKEKIYNFFVWDDNPKLRKKFKQKRIINLKKILTKVDFIVLSPGISLRITKHKKELKNFRKKIITDIDLLFLNNKKFKSIVVTGTNGKSTTCKIITHLLKKNKINASLIGNIGKPVLDTKITKNSYCVIEASSYQLSHSKFIHPNFALLLNISNDHIDWHGSKKDYIRSKFKIFSLQEKTDFALINTNYKKFFKINKYKGKLSSLKLDEYNIIKEKIQNDYLKSQSNHENMNFVFTLSKLLKINKKSFIKSMNSFSGLPHRYEIFLKRSNLTFINDSKATSFEAAKFALKSKKNIFWILGGLPKQKDKITFKEFKNNILKSYIIGKSVNFFRKQLQGEINFTISKFLKIAVANAIKDAKLLNNQNNVVLLSPAAASFDQFQNFEKRGDEFKRLCKLYVNKYY